MKQCVTSASRLVALLLLLAGATRVAQAQQKATIAPAPKVLQMPQLAEGGGHAALVQAIQQRVVYPPEALRDQAQGVSLVGFAVAPNGQVCQVRMVQGIRPDLDTAVVRAVRQLPRLQPARQFGRPVACLMRAPVTFLITDTPALPAYLLPPADSAQPRLEVMRLPRYKGEASYQQLACDLAAGYLRLAQADGCSVPRLGVAVLVTVGPGGTLYDLQLAGSTAAEQAAFTARFGTQVLTLPAGQQWELPATCLPQLQAAARHLSRLTPAYVYNQPVAMRIPLVLPATPR